MKRDNNYYKRRKKKKTERKIKIKKCSCRNAVIVEIN